MDSEYIVIKGAKEHNLKNIDVKIPRNKLVVITGVSGSGKSSLAFDTIYAEGQRRYVESLSAYARQFLGLMEKPDVESIDGLSPAISIDQKGVSHNPRSTVATVTEIYDYLRLLYARVSTAFCPNCNRKIEKQTVEQMADILETYPPGSRLMILAPIVRGRKGEFQGQLQQLSKMGYVRARIDGKIVRLDEPIELKKNIKHTIEIVVDRIVIGDTDRSRIISSLESAVALTSGLAIALNADTGQEILMSENYACPYCNISLEEPEPATFSFNSPKGACPECTGIGSRKAIDPNLIVQDPDKPIIQGAIPNWGVNKDFYNSLMLALCKEYGIDPNTPFCKLSDEQKAIFLYGTNGHIIEFEYKDYSGFKRHYTGTYEGAVALLMQRYESSGPKYIIDYLEQFITEQKCSVCKGTRLKSSSLAFRVGGLNITEFCSMSVTEALRFLNQLELSERDRLVAHQILKELTARLEFLVNVGLDYLTLDRAASTLSGGESQRLRLATQIGSKLTGVLYILDEPSIGLHQRDNKKLLNTLLGLRNLGNTVIVVEHDEETIRCADHIIDIGPGAGEHGGKVVAQGSVEDICACPLSITGDFLSGRRQIEVPKTRRKGNGKYLIVKGARANNLRSIDVTFPLGTFICVTGVSGSGKSTLINDILYRKLSQHFYKTPTVPGAHDAIIGIENIDKVINIDQSPIGRTPRSNPATYTGAFTYIRELFANLKESKIRGYDPGRFSFNKKGGRCEACEGEGLVRIEMHFLPDVYVPCEVCHGTRYAKETLEVKYKGLSIADVLNLTVDEALEVFENIPKIRAKLQTIHDVGLGYIRLGQPATTLSGGEAQRVKLSTELSKKETGNTLYLLDEPTTGLHFADVQKLLNVLQLLVEHGNTVIVIEHNLDVIKSADYIIDLGPEGGDRGGLVVATGTPEEVAMNDTSYTGQFLRRLLFVKEKPEITASAALRHP